MEWDCEVTKRRCEKLSFVVRIKITKVEKRMNFLFIGEYNWMLMELFVSFKNIYI